MAKKQQIGSASCIVLILMMALVTTAPAQSPPSINEREAIGRAITVWDQGCSGSTRGAWDGMVRAWYDEITNSAAAPNGHGTDAWEKQSFHHNTYTQTIGPNNNVWRRDGSWSEKIDGSLGATLCSSERVRK